MEVSPEFLEERGRSALVDRGSGAFDGTPVLRAHADYAPWAEVLSEHFLRLRNGGRRHRKLLRQYAATNEAEFFAVNVLAMHQQDISAQFAKSGVDKFASVDWRAGLGGVPILPEYAACFECRSEHRYEGGDHKIIVGRVLRFEDRETDPLIFYRGRFLRKGGPYPGEA